MDFAVVEGCFAVDDAAVVEGGLVVAFVVGACVVGSVSGAVGVVEAAVL